MKSKLNKAQEEFAALHPDMVKGFNEISFDKKEECTCKEPQFAYKHHSMRTDKSYFNYCLLCNKFRDVPSPVNKTLEF